MKLYVGVRTELDRRVLVTSSKGEFADYSLSVERERSSEKFRMGHWRSARGLALAILSDHLAVGVRDVGCAGVSRKRWSRRCRRISGC